MSLKQKIQEKIDELESENDRILQGVNEDCQLPDSQAQAILRSSYYNNGSIQGLKDALGLLDEATKDLMLKCKISECINWEEGDCGYGLAYRLKYCKEYKAVLVGGEKK